MDEKTKTIVTIEKHTRTVIRRSHRAVEFVPEPDPFHPQLSPVKPSSSRFSAATNALCHRLRARLKPGKSERSKS